MPPQPQKKRGIAHFFKPFPRDPEPLIPQKRDSPYSDDDDDDTIVVYTKPSKKSEPKTPSKAAGIRNGTLSGQTSLAQPIFSPRSQASLPIRSPQSNITSSKVLSPGRQRTLFETRSPPRKEPVHDPVPSLSFTFADVPDKSHNVVKDGILVAVRDSDDDDTESLESLADMFARNKKDVDREGTDSSPPQDADMMEAERVKTLSMFTGGRSVPIVGKDKLRALYAKERALNFDLSRILDEHFGDEEDEEIIRKARERSEDNDEKDRRAVDDKKLLASVVRGANQEADQDDVSRFLSAIERTEALDGEKTFSFFCHQHEADEMDEDIHTEAFPSNGIPDGLWEAGDDDGCARAFLSGVMADKAEDGELDDTALRWIFQQVVREYQDDVRHAYIRTLQSGSKSWTRLNVTATDIQKIFQILGAYPDVVRDNSAIKMRYQPQQNQNMSSPRYLPSAIKLLTVICPDMDMSALSKLTSILMRLVLDQSTMSSSILCQAIETLITTLLDLPNHESASHIYDRILSDATLHLQAPKLQVQLLSHIPPTSPRTIQLRKTLADVFLLGPGALDSTTNISNASLDQLSKHISTSPSFNLTRRSGSAPFDYTALTSLTSILDIAIGAGQPPLTSSTSTSSSPTSKTAIQAFNTSVDTLADQIQHLFISIKDTGASHMRRTEAKDALQALYYRLLYSVRIGVRKKKHVFDRQGRLKSGKIGATNDDNDNDNGGRWVSRDGDEVREERRGGEFMSRFLAKARGEV